jgi:hypothetical protein
MVERPSFIFCFFTGGCDIAGLDEVMKEEL